MELQHAIVFAWPGQGHLNPLMRFSDLLAKQGCKVTFVHSDQNLSRVTQARGKRADGGGTVDEERGGGQVEFVGIDDGVADGKARDVPSLIEATDAQRQGGLVVAFDSLVARLLQADQDRACMSFIVSDLFMTFTQDVANKYGIPRVAVFVQSAASFACHVAVSQGFRPPPGGKFLNCLPGVLPSTTRSSEMISFLQNYDPCDPIFDYMLRSFQRLSEPAWIVLNTFEELEHDAISHIQRMKDTCNIKHLDCCGPLLPPSFFTSAAQHATESMWEEDHRCLEWLNQQAPSSVLFVSFGSLVTLSARQAEELALGLESSKVPFLWVLKEGLIEADGDLPLGFVERLVRERACFVRWAPQMNVLLHPSVGGFLTHGGWNSLLESVGAGVPLLGWPTFADQLLNCRCIMDSWGVGSSFSNSSDDDDAYEEGLLPRALIEEKVRALMLELPPAVKRNCASLKVAASNAAQTRQTTLIIPLLNSLKQAPQH